MLDFHEPRRRLQCLTMFELLHPHCLAHVRLMKLSLGMNHYPIYLGPLLVCASVSCHLTVLIEIYPHTVHHPN